MTDVYMLDMGLDAIGIFSTLDAAKQAAYQIGVSSEWVFELGEGTDWDSWSAECGLWVDGYLCEQWWVHRVPLDVPDRVTVDTHRTVELRDRVVISRDVWTKELTVTFEYADNVDNPSDKGIRTTTAPHSSKNAIVGRLLADGFETHYGSSDGLMFLYRTRTVEVEITQPVALPLPPPVAPR